MYLTVKSYPYYGNSRIDSYSQSQAQWLQTFPVKQMVHLATCEAVCTRPHAVIARKEKASALRIVGVEVLLHLERVTGMSCEMQSDRSENKTKLVWIQRTNMNMLLPSWSCLGVWGCIYCPPQSGWTTWIQGESQPNACLSIYSPASRFHQTKAFLVTSLRISLFLSIANFHTLSSITLDFFYFTILPKYIFFVIFVMLLAFDHGPRDGSAGYVLCHSV